jgi:hypothetical protein
MSNRYELVEDEKAGKEQVSGDEAQESSRLIDFVSVSH